MPATHPITSAYVALKNTLDHNELKSDTITNALDFILDTTEAFLSGSNIRTIPLASDVTSKQYIAFCCAGKQSRPINKNLFPSIDEGTQAAKDFLQALRSLSFQGTTPESLTKGCYALAIMFCASIDLLKNGDQKTPGTFFEYLIGHCYARRLDTNPRKRVKVLSLSEPGASSQGAASDPELPTDFIFDLGAGKPKFHLPVKTSTRERVVQVWAHQRVLDGVYGMGRFWGTLVALAETNWQSRTNKVSEVCLPLQWKVYQLFIAQLKRVYYLDVPSKYADLNNDFPPLHVKEFGHFFFEAADLQTF